MLRLVLKPFGTIPLEVECLRADALQSLPLAKIAKLPVWHGKEKSELGAFFHFSGDAGDGIVEIEGDCSSVKRIGERMAGGTLTVRGNVGMHAGAMMAGGLLEVEGNAGDWLGAELKGGTIRVRGNADDLAGAAYRGATKGMTGGTILIHGNAGDETAAYLRRGIVAIGGDCGAYAGVGMIAGTLVVNGRLGPQAGAGMKRGTIVAFGTLDSPRASFATACVYEPNFLPLYWRYLRANGFPVPITTGAEWTRLGGDRASLGKGEILHRSEIRT